LFRPQPSLEFVTADGLRESFQPDGAASERRRDFPAVAAFRHWAQS